MKKLINSQPVSFFVFFCCVVAAIGANGYLLFDKHYVIFAANVVMTLVAVPGFVKFIHNLTGRGDSDNKDK